MPQTLALLYAALIGFVICFQVALICGAPWGRFTQGGKHDGALPSLNRIGAGFSIVLLTVMGAAILSSAGYTANWPRWTGWVAVGVSALSCLANWATPSKPERLLWGPITTVMLGLATGVMLGTRA